MKNHPPDRRLDRPEPTDAELRDEKLRAEYERAKEEEAKRAIAEERRREQFTRFMQETLRPVLEDAVGPDTAEEWTAEIWREIRRGRAA